MGSFKTKHLLKCFLKTILVFIIATLCSLLVSMLGVGNESIIMVFLLGVLFTTVLTSSYIWGIIASFASLMLFNFLFTEPRFTLVIYSSRDIMLLVFFLITAIVSGIVTSRLQQQMELAAKNERTVRTLYQIASGFLSVSGKRNIIMRGISFIHEYAGFECSVRLEKDDEIYLGSDIANESSHIQYWIKSSAGQIGIISVFANNNALSDQSKLLIQAVATQLGIALDREQLHIEQENIRLAMERERLRSTLLRSVAHDLRSPLTALSGAGNLLADNYENLADDERKKLAVDISEEIIWLIDLVENILNMTRINESQLVLKKNLEVVDDVVSEAISHLERFLSGRRFIADLPDEVIMVPMDGRLIVRVLINLLENAIRHTPPEAEIRLTVSVRSKYLEISVSDTGNGIDEKIKDSLFNKFVTLEKVVTDGRRGIGLGLAICKAIVEAHGGSIYANSNQPRGAILTFNLPMEE